MPLSLTMTSAATRPRKSLFPLLLPLPLPGWEEEEAAAPSASSSSTSSPSGARQGCPGAPRTPVPVPAASAASSAPPASSPGPASAPPPPPSAPQAHGTSGRRARPHRRLHLPTPPERARRESACRPLRSAAGCGHSSAARAPRGCPAAPPGEVCSGSVERCASRAPHPPRCWWRSSVPVGRRSAARCSASQRPGPCGRSAVRVATTNAAAALFFAVRLHRLVAG